LCLSSSSALHFFWLFFWVHHLFNQDDRHLLAHAMASDFSAAWQCKKKVLWVCFRGIRCKMFQAQVNQVFFRLFMAFSCKYNGKAKLDHAVNRFLHLGQML
jgi:hypothetical protein